MASTKTQNSKTDAAPSVADFDFGALGAPKATEAWQSSAGAASKPVPENILKALRASKQNDQAGIWPMLPGAPFANEEDAKARKLQGLAHELVKLIRRGAAELKYGVKIQVTANEDNTGSYVAFHAVDRRKFDESKPRKPVQKKDETVPEYEARMANYRRDIAAWERDNGQQAGSGEAS